MGGKTFKVHLDGYNLLPLLKAAGGDVIGLDWRIPLDHGWALLGEDVGVQGNLDPVALMAGGDALSLSAERIITNLSHGPFVFNLGHGIHKDTPVEHVAALCELLKNWRLG